MNREQKSAAIAEIAAQIEESQAIFAVDYRGISVPQVAELRGRLREADASFKVVKNSLTERAADASGAETLKELLIGPTALTFVRGDAATAAKAIADYGRTTQLLPFKGGLMDGSPLDVEQIRSLSRLPSRDALYGQLVGVVSSPVTGLVRTLGALLGGLASALGQVRTKMESGEIPSAAPAEAEPAAELAASEEPAPEAPAEAEPAAEAEAAQAPAAEEPAAQTETPEQPAAEAEAATQGEQTTQGDPETEAKPASESEAPADAAEDAPPEAAAQDAGPEGAGEADAGEDDEQGADGPTGEQSADDTSNQED